MSTSERPDRAAPAAPADTDPPRGARTMGIVRWILFGVVTVLAVASAASYVAWRVQGGAATHASGTLYHCPMHPTFTSHDPSVECPICGMDLVPVPVDTTAAGGGAPGLAPVTLDAERVQAIGVRYAVAARRPLAGPVELVAFVTPDESRLRRVSLRVGGWVERLHASRTGEVVRAGDPLLVLYSPELYQSEQEFLLVTAPDSATGRVRNPGNAAAARERLHLLGVPESEILRLEADREASTRVTLRAPFTGVVLERGVSEGQAVGPDTPLFTLADLSRLWVLGDAYESDLARVRRGMPARFVAGAVPGRSWSGRVDLVYPTLDAETRTVQVRMPVDNPDGALRPGTFGTLRVEGAAAPVVVVPSEAVIRTGERSYVFRARAGGRFEPLVVEVGVETGEWSEIRRGVAAGDTVVASASFLIDSESRLRASIAGSPAPAPSGHGH